MKYAHQIVVAALALGLGPAFGQVEIGRTPLGSGEPGQSGLEKAAPVYDNIYHAPQYLPGFPTAAVIWPRVIEVPCKKVESGLQCEGYSWNPRMGPGEYLYFIPVLAVLPMSRVPDTGAK